MNLSKAINLLLLENNFNFQKTGRPACSSAGAAPGDDDIGPGIEGRGNGEGAEVGVDAGDALWRGEGVAAEHLRDREPKELLTQLNVRLRSEHLVLSISAAFPVCFGFCRDTVWICVQQVRRLYRARDIITINKLDILEA